MASLTQWTWVWVNSGSWWWTGRPGVLQSMGSQRVGHDWATELNYPVLPRGGSIEDRSEIHVGSEPEGVSCPKQVFPRGLCAGTSNMVCGFGSETRRHSLGLQPLKWFWLPVTPINLRPALLSALLFFFFLIQIVVNGNFTLKITFADIKFGCLVLSSCFYPPEADERYHEP